jgi:hypothetical protein
MWESTHDDHSWTRVYQFNVQSIPIYIFENRINVYSIPIYRFAKTRRYHTSLCIGALEANLKAVQANLKAVQANLKAVKSHRLPMRLPSGSTNQYQVLLFSYCRYTFVHLVLNFT